jgi:hypothetical protein
MVLFRRCQGDKDRGALLFFFGVSFAQAIVVIVVGNLISWILGPGWPACPDPGRAQRRSSSPGRLSARTVPGE